MLKIGSLVVALVLCSPLASQLQLHVGPGGNQFTCGPCLHPMNTPQLFAIAYFAGTTPESLRFVVSNSGSGTSVIVCYSLQSVPTPIPDLGIPGWHVPTGCYFDTVAPFAFAASPHFVDIPDVAPLDVYLQGVGLMIDRLSTCTPYEPAMFVTNAIEIRVS